FVDAGLQGTDNDSRSLHARYTSYWADPGRRNAQLPKVVRIDATNRDAFAEIRGISGVVSVENLVYQPRPGAGDHGRAVVVTYTLIAGKQSRRVTDLDDGDDPVVDAWARWAEQDPDARRPFAIIMPHHGTRPSLTDPRPLFRERIRPEVAIFTVN